MAQLFPEHLFLYCAGSMNSLVVFNGKVFGFIIYHTKRIIMSFLSKIFDSSSYSLTDRDYEAIVESLSHCMEHDSRGAKLSRTCEGELPNGFGFELSGTIIVSYDSDEGSYFTAPASWIESVMIPSVDFVLYDDEGDRIESDFSADDLATYIKNTDGF